MRKSLQSFLIFLFLCNLSTPLVCAEPLRDSVVKVFVTSNPMNYYRPWQSRGSISSSGSGCVMAGNRILTNAHVVNEHTFIQVRKESNPKKYTAKVEAIGHDCDIAILSVEDESFFDNIKPLEFGELPQLQDTVTVIGFPMGGDKISITEGVVSRVDITRYVQSAKQLLAVQIDAALNPGNSGGPVFKDDKIIGIAMQIISNSQNIGYMIPTPIIKHFLKDLEDGKYHGFPTLGIEYNNSENNALRIYFKIAKHEGGVVVTRVLPFSSAYDVLKEGDVILEVNGISIGVDGTVEFRGNERLGFGHLINKKQSGEKIDLKISRNGKILKKSVKLQRFTGLVPYPRHFKKPSYYIYGGLIFSVLSSDLVKSFGGKWWESAPTDFLHYIIGKGHLNKEEKKEIVVLLDVLPDDANVGYHRVRKEVIAKVNNRALGSFEEFVKIVESNKDDFVVFETDQMEKIVIDTKNIYKITEKILKRNNIDSSYSDDVKEWVKKWGIDDIIANAVSLGMEFMAKRETKEKELKYNKNILIKELERRIK